ncbi:MAG: hypothetical protein Kow0042_11430 [Calditrichia bacterium]
MAEYVVYVLLSEKDGGLYIGQTADLDARLKEHHWGKVKSTRGRRPLKLVYQERVPDRERALERETPSHGDFLNLKISLPAVAHCL